MTGTPQELAIRVDVAIAFRADLLTVRTNAPLPPGSRVRLALAASGPHPEQNLSGKVVGIERAAGGDFALKVRLHSVPREDRTALEERVAFDDDGAGD